jgi:glycosyltransferase involved in cell wall biosynthesis
MRVGIIASARHPIAEPFAGGLESHVWSLADGLRRRGHDVTLFAGPGSDPRLNVELLDLRRPEISAEARHDVSMIPERWLDEHHAYLDLMLRLSGDWDGRFDVIHNHSLHHLPIAMARAVRTPMVSTLHTPPTPWLESAIQCGDGCPVTFAAVSAHTAAAWRGVVPDARVVPNGVDTEQWQEGPGGGPLVWFGRIVPEKGPHLALDAACRADMPIVLAGPIADRAYFDREVGPRLGGNARFAGHLDRAELVELVGRARAVLTTPCWDEPYGLVAAEALACGTPVCGFARGGMTEVVGPGAGVLVDPGDTDALATAIAVAVELPRARIREYAVRHCSLASMIEAYTGLYGELATTRAAA